MTREPSFRFYPADWRKDLNLRACSLEARGLWVDLMCIMHEGDPYGHLAINGESIPESSAVQILGIHVRKYRKLLNELLVKNVARKDTLGRLYSKRMVEDKHIRDIRREAGKLGGNPNLLNLKDNVLVHGNNQNEVNQKTTPSSSSSSSTTKQHIEVFDFWNRCGVIVHKKLTDKIGRKISGAISSGYGYGEIEKAIENYATVLKSPKHFFSHKWTLEDFLTRGLNKFVDEADPLKNFLSNKNGSNRATNFYECEIHHIPYDPAVGCPRCK